MCFAVALRKESVDRNVNLRVVDGSKSVALRKESVDRNLITLGGFGVGSWSLSARRAWIEISGGACAKRSAPSSLSARRAWIEITSKPGKVNVVEVALRKESVDRKYRCRCPCHPRYCRSPQGERG